jgi:RHS repeat-associated protein
MLSNDLTFPNAPANNWYSSFSFSVDPANNRLNSYSNNLGQTSIGYDLAGNILSDGVKSFVYDGAGRIASLDPNTSVYRYDALGRRVKKTYTYQNQSEATISGNIISIYGPAGELLADYTTENGPSGSNNSRTDYILNESEAVGKRTVPQSGSETIEGFHRSHLNQIFDPATYSVNSGLSSMHGIPYRSGGNEQFTGHKDDPESGLHYNLARSYNPVTARWTSPDTIVGNAYDPLSLNKYG